MAPSDRKHQKRLKEAERKLIKMNKLRVQGKISKEEFAQALRPYKDELIELGYPIKIKDKPMQEPIHEEGSIQVVSIKPSEVTVKPYEKRSTLTIEEIEHSIDRLSTGSEHGERLRRLYAERYGEELEPPVKDINVTITADRPIGSEDPTPAPGKEPSGGGDEADRKPFWKNIFSKKDDAEATGERR